MSCEIKKEWKKLDNAGRRTQIKFKITFGRKKKSFQCRHALQLINKISLATLLEYHTVREKSKHCTGNGSETENKKRKQWRSFWHQIIAKRQCISLLHLHTSKANLSSTNISQKHFCLHRCPHTHDDCDKRKGKEWTLDACVYLCVFVCCVCVCACLFVCLSV